MKIEKEKKALDKLYRRRDRYDLQPDFQREEVWSLEKEQALLDSVIKGWDIPKIYVRVIDDENYEIADGQQRLVAIYKFYDNKIQLSKKLSGEFGGLFYSDLPERVKDIFDDYELDIILIRNSSEKEIRELFRRLQLGVPLNSAEKLNAMLGNARDFVKDLSIQSFFNKTLLSKRRFSYQSVCAQIVKLEIEGIGDLKFKDLEKFYEQNSNFNKSSKKGRKILKILKFISKIFKDNEKVFRNKASIISFYFLTSQLIDIGFDLRKNGFKLRDFYINFLQRLGEEVQKGSDSTETELILYQSKINQGADSKDSVETRNNILRKRIAVYDKTFQKLLFKNKIEIATIEVGRSSEISALVDSLLELITNINKIVSAKGRDDIFKPTNEMLAQIKALKEPSTTRIKYKYFIEAAYKIFYEGSGSLARIPAKFINKNSVLIDIKALRTDVCHDIEHGKKKKIKDKKIAIANTYKKYVGLTDISLLTSGNLFLLQKKLLTELERNLILIKKSV